MKNFSLHVAGVVLLVGSTFCASQINCTTGNWTIQNQPPVNCIPFAANGIFTKQLPGASSGGPMNHLFPNSDAIVSTTMGGLLGTFRLAGPNDYYDDILGEPIYYGRASDPVYRVTGCFYTTSNPATDPHNPIGKTFHIPDQARFSNSNDSFSFSDQFFVAWDQVSNEVLGVYCNASGCRSPSLPHCTAPDAVHACPAPAWRGCNQANWSTDTAYQVKPGATGALDVPGWALVIRSNEWMSGTINHALHMNTGCEADGVVFPDLSGTAQLCANQTNRPHEGNLVFVDYTDAQITSMNLPPWQKAIITALAHYGGYIGDTNGGSPGPINVSRFESNQAYKLAGITNPIYAWLETQAGVIKQRSVVPGTFKYQMDTFGNIPNLTGPTCVLPCGVVGHIHIADPCIPLGMAGLRGGCVLPAKPSHPRKARS